MKSITHSHQLWMSTDGAQDVRSETEIRCSTSRRHTALHETGQRVEGRTSCMIFCHTKKDLDRLSRTKKTAHKICPHVGVETLANVCNTSGETLCKTRQKHERIQKRGPLEDKPIRSYSLKVSIDYSLWTGGVYLVFIVPPSYDLAQVSLTYNAS